MAAKGNGDPPVHDLRTMEELCQPSLNGIQATNFRLKNDMIQKVQNSCQFHGLLGDDANKHLDKFLHVTQSIKVNGVTDGALRGTFMKRCPKECYDLIKNMTAHHNDWDTSAQWITPNYETCGGPHSYNDCPAIVGQTQNVYAAGAYQGGNSCKPQGNHNLLSYRSENYLGPPGFNQNQNQNRNHQTRTSKTKTGIKETIIPRGITKRETNSSKELVMVKTRLQLIKPQANDAILKNMQTNMTSLKNSNLDLKNMFGQFMTMNTGSSSGSRTLPVERETEVTKDTVPPTNNKSTKDVQPSVVQTETLILNSKPAVAPIIEPVFPPVSAPKPNEKPSIPYPSKFHDQKLRDKANDQKEKFSKI
nr:hypothetical protein [Tanacetum cinerariifolium]